jgi:c-src tyrosine kinase
MIPAHGIRGGRGVVPLLTMPWFHGKITREESEHMLSQMVNGLFLVRESTHFPGDYTLSICSDKAIEHYRIQKHERTRQLTIDDESSFDNLAELIAHYEADADGLVARCIKPVKKKGNIEVVVNQNDFVQSGWMIRREDLKFEELIGKGEFSEVHKAICGGREVAVKIVKDSGMAQMFLAEASVMTSLRHPNLVELLGVVLGDVIYIVTEFMSKGSLVDYLRTRGRSVIAASDQIRFARSALTFSCFGFTIVLNYITFLYFFLLIVFSFSSSSAKVFCKTICTGSQCLSSLFHSGLEMLCEL